MKFFICKQADQAGIRIEQALRRIEARFGVALTVHDLHGRLGDPHGMPLLPGRHLHPHPCCVEGRQTEPGWNRRCSQECFGSAEQRAGTSPEPFFKECYKGLRELVVPIHYGSSHQMTIFAGVFRGELPDDGGKLPEYFLRRYQLLPEADEAMLTDLAETLRLFGTGLLKEFDREEPSGTATRRAFIRRFIRNRAHEDITLETLAAELYLSVSRAGHLVREQTGSTFSQLLEEERMLRARHLLLDTPRKLSDIAAAVGYSNACYFNRLFARRFGVSPGQYRRRQAERVD